MFSNEIEPDKSQVPLIALTPRTRSAISLQLNSKKLIQTPEGLQRDWRGIAHLIGFTNIPNDCPDPTELIINHWQKLRPPPTVGQLQDYLGRIDRWDILDDTAPLIDEDAEKYLNRKKNGYSDDQCVDLELDKHILTYHDIDRIGQGLPPQTYDAFLLFADEDYQFAHQLVDRLENDYGLRLCLQDRDMVGGQTLVHQVVMKLISQRCNRLIVILSQSLLQSPLNEFFVSYAQFIGIVQSVRKIIPCTYKKIELPSQLRHCFILDYNRSGPHMFWDKLSQSVMAPASPQQYPDTRCKVREIEDVKNGLREYKASKDFSETNREDRNQVATLSQVDQARSSQQNSDSIVKKFFIKKSNKKKAKLKTKVALETPSQSEKTLTDPQHLPDETNRCKERETEDVKNGLREYKATKDFTETNREDRNQVATLSQVDQAQSRRTLKIVKNFFTKNKTKSKTKVALETQSQSEKTPTDPLRLPDETSSLSVGEIQDMKNGIQERQLTKDIPNGIPIDNNDNVEQTQFTRL